MSLVNRMLKDLSSREPSRADVLAGTRVLQQRGQTPPRRLAKLVVLLLVAGAFTAALWWIYGPKPYTVPQPRAALSSPTPAVATNSPAAAPEAMPEVGDTAPTQEQIQAAATVAEASSKVSSAGVTPAAAPTEVVPPASPADVTASEAAFAAGQAAERRGDVKRADRLYSDALIANPHLKPAREALVELRMAQGRPVGARRVLNRGLALSPNHPAFAQLDQRLSSTEATGQHAVSVAAKATSVPSSAPATSKPTPAQPVTMAPAAPLDLAATEAAALESLVEGRVDAAAELVTSTHIREPNWPGYRRLAARIELARNRPEAVLPLLESNRPTLASDPEYHGLLASAYQRLGRHDEAAQSYQQLLRLQPEQGHWWAGYAISRDALGDRPGAQSAYRQALQRGALDPRVAGYIKERLKALQPAAN